MKLHIGGREVKEGWKLLNIMPLPGVDYLGDVCDLSQFADNSIDELYASHVLEHISQAKVGPTLKGLHRVLKPGGRLLISVPDLDVLCHAMLNPNLTPDNKFHVMRMIFGGQVDDFDYHYFGWNWTFLTSFLKGAGFSTMEKVEGFGIFTDTSDFKPYGFPISLNVIATK
ncbi:MAG: methyltransferase domain-containing protein [Rubrivivax sp.]|nr:MAG: methyltransferase domain-containing protein [Rubrivivax sp.]